MKIAVDIDGVILDMVIKVCEIFNERFNKNYTKDDVKRWEFFKDWNVPEEEIFKIFYKAYEESMTLPLIDENTLYILKKLNNQNNVDLVTARNIKYEIHLIDRLTSLDFKKGVHYINLIHVESKPYDAKIRLGYDILIDDNPNLVKSAKSFPDIRILLYDQPWNRYVGEIKNVVRVYNWKQIGKILL